MLQISSDMVEVCVEGVADRQLKIYRPLYCVIASGRPHQCTQSLGEGLKLEVISIHFKGVGLMNKTRRILFTLRVNGLTFSVQRWRGGVETVLQQKKIK